MRKISQTPTELALDLLLLLYEGPRGSGDLADALEDLRGEPVVLATFFRLLQRVVDRGWVEIEQPATSASPSSPEVSGRPGRPGRRYRLSPSGERLLRSGVELHRRRLLRAEALGLLAGE